MKVLLVVAAIPLLAAGSLYYVLGHNLGDMLTYAIEKETKGGYCFRSKAIRLSVGYKTSTIEVFPHPKRYCRGASLLQCQHNESLFIHSVVAEIADKRALSRR